MVDCTGRDQVPAEPAGAGTQYRQARVKSRACCSRMTA
jgi:hypothetical protein